MKLLGLGLCAVVITVSATWSVIKIVSISMNSHYAPEPVRRAAAAAVAPYTYVYEIKEMTFPMLSRERNRVMYGRFSVTLDCPSAAAKEALAQANSKILDSILQVTANYVIEDFSDPAGFTRLKKELLTTLAQRFPAHAPRQVFIADWTIG